MHDYHVPFLSIRQEIARLSMTFNTNSLQMWNYERESRGESPPAKNAKVEDKKY
jgi:hypothetical protein